MDVPRIRHRLRVEPARTLLVLAAVATLAGCGAQTVPRFGGRPTEEQTRDAYFDTPVIVAEQGSRIPLGIRRAELFRRLGGRAGISYPSGGRECVVYPIIHTQVWDAFGVPEAAEWEFCFGRSGRLVAKHRLGVPR